MSKNLSGKVYLVLYRILPIFNKIEKRISFFSKDINYIENLEQQYANSLLKEDIVLIKNDADFRIESIFLAGRNPFAILKLKNLEKNPKINDLIVSKNGSLIGIIFDIHDSSLKVEFINSQNVRIPGFALKHSIYGMVIGDPYDTGCEVKFKYYDGNLENDEIIITSGENGLTPRGVMIGRILLRDGDTCVIPYVNLKGIDYINLF